MTSKWFAALALLLLLPGAAYFFLHSGSRGAGGATSSGAAAAGDHPSYSAAPSSQAPPLIGRKADEHELSDLSHQLASSQVQELNDSANKLYRSNCE